MDWKALLSSVAPLIGTALGGPLGGIAVKAAADALGLSESTEEALQTALSGAKPEDLLKLKLADQQFAKDMRALDIDLERIAAGDRDSARSLAKSDSTARNLAYIIMGAFVGMCFAVLSDKVAIDSVLAGTVIGYLSAKAEQVSAFYFGSSASSKAKDETIRGMAAK